MTHVHEDMGAFVLGALDADGEKRVREHLAVCPECAAAHAELAGVAGLLDLAVTTGATEDEPLPPAIEERLLDRFARERVERPERHRWRPRLAFGLSSALAGAAIAVALLVVGLNFEKDAGRPASQYRVAFDRSSTAPADARARAGLRSTEAGTVVRLWVNNLPTGDVYEEVPAEGIERAARFHAFLIEQVDRAPENLITSGKGSAYQSALKSCQ